jgi:hypothetical protein
MSLTNTDDVRIAVVQQTIGQCGRQRHRECLLDLLKANDMSWPSSKHDNTAPVPLRCILTLSEHASIGMNLLHSMKAQSYFRHLTFTTFAVLSQLEVYFGAIQWLLFVRFRVDTPRTDLIASCSSHRSTLCNLYRNMKCLLDCS